MAEMRLWDLLHAAEITPGQYEGWRKRKLVLPAVKRGRYSAYGPEHLARVVAVRDLLDQNRTLADIRDHLDPEPDDE
jgi:DNA-binding transcriptional MerR regulator